jgi:hypothetical protein
MNMASSLVGSKRSGAFISDGQPDAPQGAGRHDRGGQ